MDFGPLVITNLCERDTVAPKPEQTAQQRSVLAVFLVLASFLQQLGKRLMKPKVLFFLRSCSIYRTLYRSLACEFSWQLGVSLIKQLHKTKKLLKKLKYLLFCITLTPVHWLSWLFILFFSNKIGWGASDVLAARHDGCCAFFFFTLWVCVFVCGRLVEWQG